MSIYLKQNYPYTRTDLSSVTDIEQSPYDNDIMEYSIVLGFGNYQRQNINNASYKNFKQFCVDLAKEDPIIDPKTNTQNKDWQWGMIPVHFKDPNIGKTNANAYNRKVLNLDFDEMKDKTWADIALLLSPYQYFAWTTFNDGMPGKGRRYRISMMLEDTFPTNSDWDIYADSIVQWIKSNGFQLDKNGSVTYCQLAILPAINDLIGTITFHWNEGVNTKKLSVINDIPFVDTVTKAVKAPTSSANNSDDADTPDDDSDQVEPAELTPIELIFLNKCKTDKSIAQDIVNIILSHPWLTKSSYQSQGLDANGKHYKPFTLCNMCCALQLIGCDKQQWRTVYRHMTSNLGRTPSNDAEQVWTKQYNRTDRKIWSINNLKFMNLQHKQKFGLSPLSINKIEYRNERKQAEYVADSKAVDYLSPDDLKSDKKVTVVIGDTGIGKTTAVSALSTDYNVRIAVPTKLIRDQQGKHEIQTYDSALNINFDDATKPEWFVLDEVHNLPSMSYRTDALVKCYDNIKDDASKYNKVILLSATLDAAMAQMLASINSDIIDSSDIEVIKRIKLNGPIKTYRVVERAHSGYQYNHILIQLIAEENAKGKLVYVVHDNGAMNKQVAKALTDMGIRTMSVSRDEINALSNADSKDNPTRAELLQFVTTKDFVMKDHGLDCIIGTRICCEGVNVCDVVDSVSVIVVGDLDPTYIRQSSGRFRNAKGIDVLHLQQAINRIPDIASYIRKRELEIDTRKATMQYWLSTNPIPTVQDWGRFVGNGLKVESKHEQACLEDGWYFDKKSQNPVRYIEELPKIVLNAFIDKAKFYADVECQEIYMEEAGFIIDSGLIVNHINPAYEIAMDDAKEEVKAIGKQSEVDKRVKYQKFMDSYFSKFSDIQCGNIDSMAKFLGVDSSVIYAVDGLCRTNDEKTKWVIDACINKWTASEVKWKYVSDSSEVVKAVSAQYPVGTWFAPADLGNVAEFVLKAQIKRMDEFGYTDISTRLSATTSIWADKLDKIDINTGSVTSPKGWNQWLKKNGFVNLEKSRKQFDGKRIEGYAVA